MCKIPQICQSLFMHQLNTNLMSISKPYTHLAYKKINALDPIHIINQGKKKLEQDINHYFTTTNPNFYKSRFKI
jgi:hypothetical protein